MALVTRLGEPKRSKLERKKIFDCELEMDIASFVLMLIAMAGLLANNVRFMFGTI